jgi:cystathionine beta-synthase
LNPNIKIVGVDPNGSILAQPESLNDANPAAEGGQQTEGIGYDFLPRVFDRTVVDDWMKGPDKESFIMARRLMREEGLMCGGSSGTAMHGAIEYIKANKIGKGKRVVVLLPDNIRNYMTKHLNSDWMYERGYITEQECAQGYNSDLVPNKDWGQDLTVEDLPLHEATFMKNTLTCREAIEMIQSTGFD